MFARIFALLPLAVIVSASYLEARDQCTTSNSYCCQTVQNQNQAQNVLQQYNLVAAAAQAGGNVGLNCTPVTVIGASNGCVDQQQPICCSNNYQNGLVNYGCSPTNVN